MSVKSFEASEKNKLVSFLFQQPKDYLNLVVLEQPYNRGRLLFGIIIGILEESRLEKTRCLWNYLNNSAVVCSSDQFSTGELEE